MACIHPLRAFATGAYTDKGKPVYFVTSHRFEYATCDDFIKRKLPFKYSLVRDYIELPCGHCVGCRKDRQYSWAFRCIAEAQDHNFNYFITLTYDDLHLPANNSLVKRDLQLFNKRLRKIHPFRFFACGEYGETSFRPHYHGIYFFDEPFLDFRLWSHHGSYDLYNSKLISDCWGKGFVVIGTLTPAAAAYCAKYVLKFDPRIDASKEPAFIVMSRKPAIGDAFFASKQDAASLVLPSGTGSILRGGFPRYFKLKHDLSKCDRELLSFKEYSAFLASSCADMDTFRDLEDYLLKHPLAR